MSMENLPYMFNSELKVLQGTLDRVKFGSVTIRVKNGLIRQDWKPKIIRTGKPRSRDKPIRAPTVVGPYAETQDLMSEIRDLQSETQVTVKVVDSRPQKWDMEEIEGDPFIPAVRAPVQNN